MTCPPVNNHFEAHCSFVYTRANNFGFEQLLFECSGYDFIGNTLLQFDWLNAHYEDCGDKPSTQRRSGQTTTSSNDRWTTEA